MVDGWGTATIEEIAEKVAMGPFGSSIKVETFLSEGVPIISGQHLHGIKVDDTQGFNFIGYEHAQRLANANVTRGDIVLTHRGTIGQVAYIPDNSQFDHYVVSQSQFYIRCDRTKVIPEFVVSYLRSPEGQHRLLANTSQVGVPSIAQPVTYLRTIEIPIPPLPEQRFIAHILGTVDDKIELNRRMNQTLEEMARAIFQDWFVDFGPVRAKLEGREPYLPLELWDLFPDRLVDSELGGIPEGWGVKVLRDLCAKPQYGYTASAQDGSVGPKFLRITDINKQAWISWETVPHCAITDEDFRKYRLHVGDILIARMADPGHGCLIEDAQSAVFASYLIRFRPALESYARFLQYWLRSDGYWDLVRERGAGTTRTSLNAQVLGEFPLLIPSNAVMEAFKEKVDCLRTRVVANVEEIRFLVAQRDALLPKLVAGEVKTVYALALEVQPDKGLLGK